MDNLLTSNIKLLDSFKTKINELVSLKNQLLTMFITLKQKNDIQTMNFKLRSYSKWLQNISAIMYSMNQMVNGESIDNPKIEEGIQTVYRSDLSQLNNTKHLKLTSGLEKKLIEFIDSQHIGDIDETMKEIEDLKLKLCDSSKGSVSGGCGGDSVSGGGGVDIVSGSVSGSVSGVDNNGVINGSTKIDTSKIEAIPKNMLHETRPKDKIGGMIYDLKLVTGIGGANAKTLANADISLENLIKDWTEYVQKDKNNAILLTSKMGKPDKYTANEWSTFSHSKRHKVHLDLLKKRLVQDTSYLHKLNHHQLIGIKYFDDISKKIPRDEIQSIEKILKVVTKKMSDDFNISICGSYRRGRSRSGDIDALLTHTSINTMEDLKLYGQEILSKFIFILENAGFLIDHLTEDSTTKYMGICMCPKKSKIARRIDVRFVPFQSYSSSILYFTGSKNFNTAMRAHALHKGYTLSEYGLYKLENGKKTEQIMCSTEKDIFDVLEYPYVSPEQRDV